MWAGKAQQKFLQLDPFQVEFHRFPWSSAIEYLSFQLQWWYVLFWCKDIGRENELNLKFFFNLKIPGLSAAVHLSWWHVLFWCKDIEREDKLKFKSNRQHLENLSFISSKELVGFKILSVSQGKTSNISKPGKFRCVGFFWSYFFFSLKMQGWSLKPIIVAWCWFNKATNRDLSNSH